ncbi:hypothetical protein C4J87_0366 [Pseudomonas sp. R1-43-08]|nr:hypothetical protein C4J87_0366 [Pseudomonas sp. R1-43-08]
MVRSRVLRTHLYLYVQAYAIKRPTFRARVWIFFERAWEPWKLRLRGVMKFLTRESHSEGGLSRQRGFAPCWGVK